MTARGGTHQLHMRIEGDHQTSWWLTCHDPERATCQQVDENGQPDGDACFLITWFEEQGDEMLACCPWPTDPHFPLWVCWFGDPENPLIEMDFDAYLPVSSLEGE